MATPAPEFIAYYRVSTDRQGASGLGLDAQRQAARHHAGSGQLIAEYTEIESGRRHTNRPQLLAGLAECRKRRAVLLIARLDRLARNVAFIANLMGSGADFIACDMPTANRLTIHILAAVAEHEREMISKRTKAALAEAKRRGNRLGNPRLADARRQAMRTHQRCRRLKAGRFCAMIDRLLVVHAASLKEETISEHTRRATCASMLRESRRVEINRSLQ